jgi:hypothetical protein
MQLELFLSSRFQPFWPVYCLETTAQEYAVESKCMTLWDIRVLDDVPLSVVQATQLRKISRCEVLLKGLEWLE